MEKFGLEKAYVAIGAANIAYGCGFVTFLPVVSKRLYGQLSRIYPVSELDYEMSLCKNIVVTLGITDTGLNCS